MRELFLLVLIGSIMVSCATVKPIEQKAAKIEHIFNKSYSLNEQNEAYIGESIVRVKDYWVEKRPVKKMIAKEDFTIVVPLGPNAVFTKGDMFTITGTTLIDGRNALLLQTPWPHGGSVNTVVFEDGCFANELIGSLNQKLMGWDTIPEVFCFDRTDAEEILKSKTFINYELVFTGLNDKEIKLLYREYSPDDMARAAFFQNLTYPKTTDTIRFRRLKILLKDVNNERIIYTVIED